MYRLSENVALKILKNAKSPQMSSLDVTQENPFLPKNFNSIGIIDPYAAIGTDFEFVLEVPYPYINRHLPNLSGLDGYWLYRKDELLQPMEPFSVPRYLADPNILDAEEQMNVEDCSIVLPNEIEKLTCISIMSFEKLIEYVPLILDSLNKDLK